MKRKRVVLFFILVLAFFLRFYRLTGVPPGFTDDEASIGYNAYSVLKTGKDEYGKFLPIAYYKSLGDYKLPLNMYLVALSEAVFGLNKFAVRFPAAFLGSLSVFVVYFVVKELFPYKDDPLKEKSKTQAQGGSSSLLALFSAFLLTISPWHIFSNRLGYEINIANFLFLLGVLFLVKGLRKSKYFLLAILFFLLTLYTYHSYWIFVPAFLIVVLFVYKEKILKFVFAYKWQLSLLIFISVWPLLLSLFNSEYKNQRVGRNIFGQQVIKEANSGFNACRLKMPGLICRLVHNRPTRVMRVFFGNYLMSFSFLVFFAPTGFDPRDTMPNRGLLYLFEFPLIFIALIFLIKNRHPALKIILPWALVYPLSHSLTEFSTATRMFLLLPLPQILAGFGFYTLFTRRKILSLIFTSLVFFSLFKFIPDVFIYQPYAFSQDSQYGSRKLYDYLKDKYEQTNQRIFINAKAMHYIKYAFYERLDPIILQERRNAYSRIGDRKVLLVDGNFIIIDSLPNSDLKYNDILVDLSDNFPKSIQSEKIIYYLNGQKYATIVIGENYLEVLD